MLLSEIYNDIATRIGTDAVYLVSDAIPLCFRSAFTEIMRLRSSETSLSPLFEDEMSSLVDHVAVGVFLGDKGFGDYKVSDIGDVSYVYGVSTSDEIRISFKYVSMQEMNDTVNNPNTAPEAGEGIWSKEGARIRVATKTTRDPLSIELLVVRNPEYSIFTDTTTDFSEYGLGFINAVIEQSVNKLYNTLNAGGKNGNDPNRNKK